VRNLHTKIDQVRYVSQHSDGYIEQMRKAVEQIFVGELTNTANHQYSSTIIRHKATSDSTQTKCTYSFSRGNHFHQSHWRI